jgi:hypothetical protein
METTRGAMTIYRGISELAGKGYTVDRSVGRSEKGKKDNICEISRIKA